MRFILIALLLSCLAAGVAPAASGKLTIRYHGHSCFTLAGDFSRMIFDPFGKVVDYTLPAERIGIVMVSHEHADHNNVEGIPGFPIILRGLKEGGKVHDSPEFSLGQIHIKGFPSYHDDQRGSLRGLNTIFRVEIGGFRIAHLGDLGCMLTEEQEKELKNLDVLLIPVGGFFTIGPEQAAEIVKKLKPVVTIPMHYKTEKTANLPIQPLEAFLKFFPDAVRVKGNALSFTIDKLFEKPGVYVLEIGK
ncbi:MAG: MBL fold metallo-hydrolase [Acidobacteria bacterium]|nr:MBL fold metallo-hydrolase [Acidobacteriota bacterium]